MFGVFHHLSRLTTVCKVAYTACSTTNGVLSLDPYVLRLNNVTAGHIYGNTGTR